MKNKLCIIQARVGSTRLPAKMMIKICGRPILEHVIRRVKRSKLIDTVVVATTNFRADDVIERLAVTLGITAFRGDPVDVLDRFYRCAEKLAADIVIRVTGDCPLIDPAVIDKTLEHFLQNNFDYVSNAYPIATYPDGLDVEIFSARALKKTWQEAALPSEREHVTPYMWKNAKGEFSLGSIRAKDDMSAKRWTIDEAADLKFLTVIYEELYRDKEYFTTEDVLRFLEGHPEVEALNSHTGRNEGYEKSVRKDNVRR